MVVEETTGRVLLVMFERRPWTGGELQLWQLQEKLNAYASFALDGEMQESHPQLAGHPVCIQLRSRHEPSDKALGLIEQARQQLRLMEIELEVWHIGEEREDAPGTATCACGNGSCGGESNGRSNPHPR
jgi:hypothetical protein